VFEPWQDVADRPVFAAFGLPQRWILSNKKTEKFTKGMDGPAVT